MSLSERERETIVNMNDGEEVAHVYTAQRRLITRLKNNPAAVLVGEGTHEGSAWARFTVPAELVSFRSVRRRVELTGERRQARSEAMRELHERGRLGSAKTA
jgi:hypothetical protein